MNRTASIRLRGINIAFFKDNLIHIILLSLTVFSILEGIILYDSQESLFVFVQKNFTEYVNDKIGLSYFKIFLDSFVVSFELVAICFLCGTSVLGLVISPLILMLAGFGYGCFSGYLYSTYGLMGILYNMFVLLPPSLLMIFVLLLSARECVGFSRLIASFCIKNTRPRNLFNDFKFFSIKHLVFLVIVIVSALIEAGLFCLFKNYFTF